jgi:hypothetical protein
VPALLQVWHSPGALAAGTHALSPVLRAWHVRGAVHAVVAQPLQRVSPELAAAQHCRQKPVPSPLPTQSPQALQ